MVVIMKSKKRMNIMTSKKKCPKEKCQKKECLKRRCPKKELNLAQRMKKKLVATVLYARDKLMVMFPKNLRQRNKG